MTKLVQLRREVRAMATPPGDPVNVIKITKLDGTTVYVGEVETCAHCHRRIWRFGYKFTGPDGESLYGWADRDDVIECQPDRVGWREVEHEPIGCVFPPALA